MKQLLAFVVMLLSASVLYAQDIITLRTGETISGRISEVGIYEIRYYKSDNPDGPVYVTSKADVAEIVYANGKKDVFKTQAQPVTQTRKYGRRSGRNFYRPYLYPIITPHIDLGHHGFFGGHHGGGHHGGGHH
ncbi:MAG: hypothetical protein KGZ59_07700 [Chitinophagaceae bacterium]|nr:hypothetical protein [Chitinophagaceae bacterium]